MEVPTNLYEDGGYPFSWLNNTLQDVLGIGGILWRNLARATG